MTFRMIGEGAAAPDPQIWINQTREKIGVLFGDPTTKPGGNGQEFAIWQEVQFLGSKQEMAEEQYGSNKKTDTIKVPIKDTIRFKVTKNKTAPTTGQRGSYVQALRATDAYGKGAILEEEQLYKYAMRYLVETIGKGSNKSYKLGDEEFSSQKAVLAALREDEEIRSATKQVLMKHLGDFVPA
jgi:RecA/RadA recombinase